MPKETFTECRSIDTNLDMSPKQHEASHNCDVTAAFNVLIMCIWTLTRGEARIQTMFSSLLYPTSSSSFRFTNLQTILLVIACDLQISFQARSSVVCRLSTIANRVHHGVLTNAAWHVDKGLTSRYKKLVPRPVRSSAALTLV